MSSAGRFFLLVHLEVLLSESSPGIMVANDWRQQDLPAHPGSSPAEKSLNQNTTIWIHSILYRKLCKSYLRGHRRVTERVSKVHPGCVLRFWTELSRFSIKTASYLWLQMKTKIIKIQKTCLFGKMQSAKVSKSFKQRQIWMAGS